MLHYSRGRQNFRKEVAKQMNLTLLISEIESVDKEVKESSETTISCVITGITAAVTVSWRTSSGKVSGTNFTPTQGTYSNGEQTSTLTVKGAQVITDTAYTCRITSGSLPSSAHSDTTVNLNVYGRQQHFHYSYSNMIYISSLKEL